MDLIDCYQIRQSEECLNLTHIFYTKLSKCLKDLPVQLKYQNFMEFEFLFLLKKIGNRSVLSKGKFENSNILTLNINTMLQKIQNYAISVQRTKALKRLFKISSKLNYINLKVQPNSGQLTLKSSTLLSFNSFTLNGSDIITYFLAIHEIIIQQFETILSQILFQLTYEVEYQNKSTHKNLKLAHQLKTFTKSASHYAWNILQSNTKSNKKDKNYIYQQSKSRFRKLKPTLNSKQKRNNLMLSKSSVSPIQLNTPFFILKLHDDELLKSNYLSGKLLNKDQKLINQICLTTEELKELQNQDYIKIKNRSGEKLKLFLSKKQVTDREIYQRYVLEKLTEFQFTGIPKYYYHFDKNDQSFSLILTNLVDSNPYNKFIENNNKTISISTKLFLLGQISNALRYLRDHKIVYHNLLPQNIFIRKGLVLKITDFSNSFNQQIYSIMHDEKQKDHRIDKYQPFQNKLPYVYNILTCQNKSFDDQRADVYSIGVVMYQLLFQKLPINIKRSKYLNLKNSECPNILSKILVHTDNFSSINDWIGKIIGNFLLSSLSNQFINKDQEQVDFNQLKLNLKRRPYLDWFNIVIKHLSASID